MDNCEKLLAFAQEIMESFPHGGIEGDDLQEIAVRHGLLEPTTVTQSCGDGCNCEFYDGEFPMECYRHTALLKGEE